MRYQFKLDRKTYRQKLELFKNVDLMKFHKYLTESLDVKESDKVLDVGCGYGCTLRYITKKIGRNGEAIGLDIDEKSLAFAERLLKNSIRDGKLKLVKANAAKKMAFGDGYFNKIVCHNVLECIPNKIEFINELHRILRNDGLIVMSHSDFDTQVYNSSFIDLTRKLVQNYSDTKQDWQETSDGLMGRKLPGIFQKTKFRRFDLKTYVMANTKYEPFEYGFTLSKGIIDIALKSNKFKKSDIDQWVKDLESLDEKKEYFYSINIYIILARK